MIVCDLLVTDNQIAEDKKPAVYRNSGPKNVLERKQTAIQRKSGAVFFLPAKSSHSSRIIIPNKRFLEDDYHKVEISPKKPKVENSSGDVKKGSTLTVPSTYRCLTDTGKQIKSDIGATASEVACKADIVADVEFESNERKLCTSNADEQAQKSGSENNDLKSVSMSAQTVEQDSLKSKSISPTGSILQRPKLCLDQTAVDRSKVEFAKSLQSQMAQETHSELPDTSHIVCSSSSAGSVTNPELLSISTSAPSSNNTSSVTCSSWTSRTGKCYSIVIIWY